MHSFIKFLPKNPTYKASNDLNFIHTFYTTLLVKYFNDLLGVQSSDRSRGEVTFFYVGTVLCIHLGSKYADFQEKSAYVNT